jgi:hypothetical protein
MANELSYWRAFIVQYFDLEELRTLCFDLGVKFDTLPGEELGAKTRELLSYLERHEPERLAELRAQLEELRPGPFARADLRLPKPQSLPDALTPAIPVRSRIREGGTNWIGTIAVFRSRYLILTLLGLVTIAVVILLLFKSTGPLKEGVTNNLVFRISRSTSEVIRADDQLIVVDPGESLLLNVDTVTGNLNVVNGLECRWTALEGQLDNPGSCTSVSYKAPAVPGRKDSIGLEISSSSGSRIDIVLSLSVVVSSGEAGE